MSSPSWSTIPKISLSFLLFFFISPSFSSATYLASTSTINDPSPLSSKAYLPKLEAEKLIRELNLFPKDSINTRAGDPAFVPGKIVEKKFTFPNLDASAGPSVEELGHHAGYYDLPHSFAARMFYFFFESRNSKDDPVVMWLSGGPGCSSELALFYENGPFLFANNSSLVWNDYGWDKASNILYVDQPTGTGFSYTFDDADIRRDEEGVSIDLYDFLQAFFKEHPQFVNNDFYITGESYAGHYIPALASRVHEGNIAKEGIQINLKGFAIGNGLTNPAIQYEAYAEFALGRGLIQKADYDTIQNLMLPRCELDTNACVTFGGPTCLAALFDCNNIFSQILSIAGDINYYDIRKKCVGQMCYDFSNVETYLNQKTVKDALGVGDLEFVPCSTKVYDAMILDYMKNLEVGIPALLEDGIRMLVYAGEEDLICNWLGNSKWVHAMEWSGQQDFGASHTVPFLVDGAEAGSLKSYGPLSFLKVHDAGHMVPMDQPKAALQMLISWMEGKLNMTRRQDNVSP